MVLAIHIVVCITLILFVLLQSGKEGMGVIFGGGSTSLFGATGAGGILVKLTTIAAVVFIFTSLGYNLLSSKRFNQTKSVIEMTVNKNPFAPESPVAPAAPATPAVPAAPATPAAQ